MAALAPSPQRGHASGMKSVPDIRVSYPYPLGSTVTTDGTNFSIFSANATGMQIAFFNNASDASPFTTVTLDPARDRTSHYWHIFVPGIRAGQLYGYRADGPNDPADGQRFDKNKVLLDPYGKSVSTATYDRHSAALAGDTAACCMKSVVVELAAFDWQADKPLNRPFRDSIIYELHVAGFTRHPSSGVTEEHKGTYLGLIEKIPYLQQLGITAVELLPVFQFDAQDAPHGLTNYWGYSPVSFFAPHLAYSSSGNPLDCIDEFRTMVRAMHHAGIEVILDVVYNHTAEGGANGPTLCFRGLENSAYYLLNKDGAIYEDYTGAGNTLRANHSVVKRLILDSLRYWVSEMHVDGFRFDLASVFSRNEAGEPMLNSPIIWEIDSDPVLAGTKLIAEAWDEGGLYQVGSFGPDKWKEWNGHFRDDVRGFAKGDQDTTRRLAARITGSFDLYGNGYRPEGQSINFVTCHDGFTLEDLVSYNIKHNEANLELNKDGTNDNLSWNCGAEGETDDLSVELIRARQIKNLLALTLLSVGTPMLLMGDEVRHTQRGNNNAYCQNNEISWLDWNLCQRDKDLLRFVQKMTRARLRFDRTEEGVRISLRDYLSKADVQWHGTEVGKPDWGADSHSLAYSLENFALSTARYIAINAYWRPLTFQLPPVPKAQSSGWLRLMDTSLPSPHDLVEEGCGEPVTGSTYMVNPRSIIMLQYEYPR